MAFTRAVYIQILENRMIARNLADGQSVEHRASPGFSHPRMLVGDFVAAQACIKSVLQEARGRGLALRTRVLVHPLETVEGGLTPVEERMIHELAIGAGASAVKVWVGKTLTDREAQAMLDG